MTRLSERTSSAAGPSFRRLSPHLESLGDLTTPITCWTDLLCLQFYEQNHNFGPRYSMQHHVSGVVHNERRRRGGVIIPFSNTSSYETIFSSYGLIAERYSLCMPKRSYSRMLTTQRMQSPAFMSLKAWLILSRGWQWVMNSSTLRSPFR